MKSGILNASIRSLFVLPLLLQLKEMRQDQQKKLSNEQK